MHLRLGWLIFLAAMMLAVPLAAQQKEFTNWPRGASPREIGKRVAERFLARPGTDYRKAQFPYIIYPETVAWYGALTFAQASGDRDLAQRLIERFDSLIANEPNMVPKPIHVDNTVFGAVPLEVYLQTRQPKHLDLGRMLADAQWEDPTPEGLTKQSRFWIDDMYMITAVQVQAFRATGDRKYIDRAALEMTAYLDRLQQPNGLFYHANDVPYFWSRGNGWVAAGMTELLRSLPADHPQRARILAGYRKMMAALVKCQGKDGMWRQLLDHPDFWPESSGTGMFTFAMITGAKNGWLQEKVYRRAARKGWLALVNYLDANGDIRNVCEGTNKKNDLEYYRNRPRLTGDLHGQAPVLWSATALLR